MPGRVEGKVALITGAARGQGRSHALRLAGEGADIIALDICDQIDSNTFPMSSDEDLAETVRQVEGIGQRVVARQVDVRDRASLIAATTEAVQILGRLDVAVANAGICPTGPDLPVQAFIDVVQVNFGGVLSTFEAALPHLGAGGSLIGIGSVAAMSGQAAVDESATGTVGYVWAKRALANLVHTLSLQCAPREIRVNAVHPTNVATSMLHNEPMYKVFRPDLEKPTLEETVPAFATLQPWPIPWVEPSDISNAVLFLASDESRYVTGLQLKVDGGCMTRQPYPGMGVAVG
jgi:SDR family mycofactocin-dependent oxidoreductase